MHFPPSLIMARLALVRKAQDSRITSGNERRISNVTHTYVLAGINVQKLMPFYAIYTKVHTSRDAQWWTSSQITFFTKIVFPIGYFYFTFIFLILARRLFHYRLFVLKKIQTNKKIFFKNDYSNKTVLKFKRCAAMPAHKYFHDCKNQ